MQRHLLFRQRQQHGRGTARGYTNITTWLDIGWLLLDMLVVVILLYSFVEVIVVLVAQSSFGFGMVMISRSR
jgi:hypothetical protein